jgi:hypothetical protein
MDKQRILDEIKRTAEANGGTPLGTARFSRETGIKVSDWRGKIWSKWGDALLEAGYQPNRLQTAYDDGFLIESFIGLARDLGRLPVDEEIKMKARGDDGFPWHTAFARFGLKREFVAKIMEYCKGRPGYEDVTELCLPVVARLDGKRKSEDSVDEPATDSPARTKEGFVYMALLKLGRDKRYKIGKAVLVERRKDQISLQLPEDLELVHAIRTDDAYGIEDYWHRRFTTKNTKGEWFLLSRQDVDAFKRRRLM